MELYKKAHEMFLRAGEKLTDEDAVRSYLLFDPWRPGVEYITGQRIHYEEKLYRVRKDHTSQEDWIPGSGTESLYQRIDVTHAGTLDDPIPYEGNMALEQGKYYEQEGVVYLCIRDTINPVYNALAELVGIFVEVA